LQYGGYWRHQKRFSGRSHDDDDVDDNDKDKDSSSSSSSSSNDSHSLNIDPVVHNDRKRNHHIAFRWLPKWTKISEEERDAKYADWKVTVRYYHRDIHDDDIDVNKNENENKNEDQEQDATTTTKVVTTAWSSQSSPSSMMREATYSVHRTILAPQSEYFESLFSGSFLETIEQKSVVELPYTGDDHKAVTLHDFETILDCRYDHPVVGYSSDSIRWN
jgi:hypothetical protein